MLIKPAQDRARDLEVLERLASTPGIAAATVERIRQEMRNIRAGQKGEAEAAYEIGFHFGSSRNWAVIHDLRLEFQGRVAQIDHLLINRCLDAWVCESKHFSEGVSINEAGEFTAFYARRAYGVPSPLEQNRKHVAVLQAVFGSGIVQLPTRLGLALAPNVKSVVLVSKGARITRPKARVDGIDQVIKSDQLRSLIDKDVDRASVAATLLSVTKIVGPETLEAFARQIAGLHRPIEFNWAAKFGVDVPAGAPAAPHAATVPAAAEAPSEPVRASMAHADMAPAKPVSVPAPSPRPSPADGDDKLSTSKLAAKHGLKTAGDMIERLTRLGYLERQQEQLRLTAQGAAAGAVFVEKSRYGPYFLWPAHLPVAR